MALPHSLQRTLIIAPHPDDDVIAAGGLMQRAIAGGGELRVLFITDGDNNPWPQRFMQRKWFLSAADRSSWGSTRRQEALCSLALFGIAPECATFLALPDSGMARMARRGVAEVSEAIRRVIDDFQPTLVVSPSSFDLHADHRAVSFFVHNAAPERAIVTYVVHGKGPGGRLALRIALSDRERQRKREAIECHRSQLALSRRRFLAYARTGESFYRAEFDVARPSSLLQEKLTEVHYGFRVLFGLDPAPEETAVVALGDEVAIEPPVRSTRIR